jgi:dihydroceramidase
VGALFLLLGWLGAGDGHPGGPDECVRFEDCYCETVGPGPIAQPANTWSNLAYVAVGFAVLADVRRRRRRADPVALIDREPVYGMLLGLTTIGIGIGSFAFHGSMRAWGGFADLLAMHLYLGAVVAYDLVRIHAWSLRRGLAVWAGFGIGSAMLLLLLPPQHGRVLFGVLVGVTLLVEAAVSFPALRPWERRVLRPNRVPWFWAGMASFAAAFVVWNLSRTGGVWCDPASLWQGHALWHLLTATTVWCLHRYFCAEGPAAVRAPARPDSVGGDG